MPPPLLRPYLRDRISLVQHEVEAYLNKDAVKASLAIKVPPSLEALIEDWVKGLTPEQRVRMYGIGEVIKLASLKGRYKELPAKQMVASALYKCGFIQIRSWKKQLRNRRYWGLGA
jgi:hypothetical protein